MDTAELWYLSATELAVAIRTKKISPVEVVDAVLARIERLNPILNAYCTVTPDAARSAAKDAEAAVMRGESLGPLHGVPVSIKDTLMTKGVRTTWGSKAFEHFIPDEDAPVVERVGGGQEVGQLAAQEGLRLRLELRVAQERVLARLVEGELDLAA